MRTIRFKESVNLKLILVGIICAIAVSILLSIGIASLIHNGTVNTNTSGYLMALVHFVSMLLSCVLIRSMMKQRDALIAALVGVGYMLILLVVNMMIYSNGIHNFAFILIGISAGILVSLIQTRQARPGNRHMKKVRIR